MTSGARRTAQAFEGVKANQAVHPVAAMCARWASLPAARTRGKSDAVQTSRFRAELGDLIEQIHRESEDGEERPPRAGFGSAQLHGLASERAADGGYTYVPMGPGRAHAYRVDR